MAVDTAYRNRGVGRMLVEWGLAKADELGLESLIEASPLGRWLYEKYDYRFMMAIAMDTEHPNASAEWRIYAKLLGPATFHVLWRPVRGDWGGPQSPWEAMFEVERASNSSR